MHQFIRTRRLAGALLLTGLAAACGRGEPDVDPAVVDSHLNQIIANDLAERANLVDEARAREEVREQEMEERIDNYSGKAN
jgi:hypothetical protein